jgi:hypothetical protein
VAHLCASSSHIVAPGKILTPEKSSLRLSSGRSLKRKNTQTRCFLLCRVITKIRGSMENPHKSMQNMIIHLITSKFVGICNSKLQSLCMNFACIRHVATTRWGPPAGPWRHGARRTVQRRVVATHWRQRPALQRRIPRHGRISLGSGVHMIQG